MNETDGVVDDIVECSEGEVALDHRPTSLPGVRNPQQSRGDDHTESAGGILLRYPAQINDMTARDGTSPVEDVVRESVCADPAVEFVVLFGSQTTGAAGPASDIDIAIKFTDQLSAQERFQKWCFFAGDLQHEAAPAVDVSDIEQLPIDVAHDAVAGEVLCGDSDAFERFKARIDDRFETERDDLRKHQRAVIDRIAEEGLRG